MIQKLPLKKASRVLTKKANNPVISLFVFELIFLAIYKLMTIEMIAISKHII